MVINAKTHNRTWLHLQEDKSFKLEEAMTGKDAMSMLAENVNKKLVETEP